jgi:alkylation response protein AidB-like acyl-CoA dehydrogenase
MGYSAEMAVEKGYRDSRINRIFEGTNEINRLLIADTAMKRAMKGDFDLFGQAEKTYGSLQSLSNGKTGGLSYFDEKNHYVQNFKKIILIVMHGAVKKFDKQLVHEQEVMNNISDIMAETYVAESLALRVQKVEGMKGEAAAALYRDILDVFVYDSASKIRKSALDAIYAFAEPQEAIILAKSVETLTTVAGVNVKEARRRIADKLIEDNAYKF